MIITCGIFLYDKVNKTFLTERAYGGRALEKLSIPKGCFDTSDENYFDAAIRETKEETGLDLYEIFDEGEGLIEGKNVFNLGFSEYDSKTKKLAAFLVICDRDLSTFTLTCNSYFIKNGNEYPEVSDFYWLSSDECEKRLHATQVKLIPKIKKMI